MAAPARRLRPTVEWTLLLLTVVSGLVDAVSFVGLNQVFVANMTGNVALLGFAMAGTPGLSAAALVVSLAGSSAARCWAAGSAACWGSGGGAGWRPRWASRPR